MDMPTWLGPATEEYLDFRQFELDPLISRYCDRLSRRDGGTIAKLYSTGSGDRPTLPARNALRLGYNLADLGSRRLLSAHRVGQTGCQWCHVNCRHWHWVDVDYTEEGRDRYLDDFEPTYALFAMLDLQPRDDSLQARLDLLETADRQVVVPIEQLGMDVIDVGVGLAGLFEGLERGLIPAGDVPPSLRRGPFFGNLRAVSEAIEALRGSRRWPAVAALGDGPQALAETYPALRDSVFTCGPGTLGNAGHANALWTFLMPFSRYFGHYSGQIYKVSRDLTPDMDDAAIGALLEDVIDTMLAREFFICLGNSLSACAFTFVAFSEDGEGEHLGSAGLLERALAFYGIGVRREDLLWFAQTFWCQSVKMKADYGWRPPEVSDYPARVYEALSQALDRPVNDVRRLMGLLIDVWCRRSAEVAQRFGYDLPW
jgi:aldehyde:ferredoxin oxidoreductase